MQYHDFLDTVKVIRMLYDIESSTKFFETNVVNYPDIIDIKKLKSYSLDNTQTKSEDK